MNFNVDVEAILTQQQRLLGENNEFREIISRLEAEIKLLKDDKGGKEVSGSGKNDKDDKEESGSRKKEEARGSKEERGSE
jgi:hypothetical protein